MERSLANGRIARQGTILTLTPQRAKRRRNGAPMDDTQSEFTISEAAALKGVRRSTIHTAIQEGRLAAHTKTLRSAAGLERQIWIIDRQDLAAWQPTDRHESGRRGAAARHRKAQGETQGQAGDQAGDHGQEDAPHGQA